MGFDPIYQSSAQEVGRKLVAHKYDLVYGGGSVGLMGVVADEVLSLKGQVTGVITEKLHAWEVGHDGLTQLHIVKTMHERKAMMAQLSDGFIALPGGIGTLEEITEITHLATIRLSSKTLRHFEYCWLLQCIYHFLRPNGHPRVFGC